MSKKQEGSVSFIYMAGDIGGTNARLQLIERRVSPNRKVAGEPQILPAVPELNKWYGPDSEGCDERLLARDEFKSIDFKQHKERGLSVILDTFLKRYSSYAPKACTLGMAGPINAEEHKGTITQHGWTLTAREISQNWNIPQVKLVNDFVAAGYGLLGLTSDATESLTPNLHRDRKAPIACLGAGTGLGEVYLIHNGTEYEAWPTEGGHTSFAARSMLEFELREYCRQALNIETVSVERLVSGMFFPHTYWFFAKKFPHLENKEVSSSIRKAEANEKLGEKKDKSIPPASRIITVHALKKTDKVCIMAQDMFVALYGAEAGDLALKTLPFGGLYVAGGTTNKVLETIKEDNKFMNNFRTKGRLSSVVSRVPVYVVKEPACDNLGLLGSRVLCRRILRSTISKEAMIRSKM